MKFKCCCGDCIHWSLPEATVSLRPFWPILKTALGGRCEIEEAAMPSTYYCSKGEPMKNSWAEKLGGMYGQDGNGEV